MPTYEYKCDACGHLFEKFQSIKAAPIKKCPECGKNAVRRLISGGAALIFKGSGFYITDYRDSNYKESAKADSSDGGSKSSDSGSKSSDGGAKPAESNASTQTKPAGESKPAGDAKPKAEPKSESKPETKTASKSAAKPRSRTKE
jgi:putative FmdB family regulatory protein